MSWNIQLRDDIGVVWVTCSANLSMDDMTMIVIEASFAAKREGWGRMLFDFADAGMAFPAEQLGTFLDCFAECSVPLSTRCALVVPGMGGSKDLSGLLTAAREYGYRIDLLPERQQIITWLSETA